MGEFTSTAERPASPEALRAEIAFKKKMRSCQQRGEVLSESMEAALFAQCVELQKLKAPATAVFPDLDEMIVIGGDGRYEVSGYVDSQNASGVMIRENFTFNVEKTGDSWGCDEQLAKASVSGLKETTEPVNHGYTYTSGTNTAQKFCKHCGSRIDVDCVICPKCGKQVEELKSEQPQVVINNSNQNTNTNVNTNVNAGWRGGKRCNKWTAFLLCLLLGFIGAHKFYEGKAGMGVLYLLTGGLFGIGWILDIIAILLKPNPYYV